MDMGEKITEIILYRDSSKRSDAIQNALEKRCVAFSTLYGKPYSDSRDEDVPAIQTELGTIRGYHNICRYFIPEAATEGLW